MFQITCTVLFGHKQGWQDQTKGNYQWYFLSSLFLWLVFEIILCCEINAWLIILYHAKHFSNKPSALFAMFIACIYFTNKSKYICILLKSLWSFVFSFFKDLIQPSGCCASATNLYLFIWLFFNAIKRSECGQLAVSQQWTGTCRLGLLYSICKTQV